MNEIGLMLAIAGGIALGGAAIRYMPILITTLRNTLVAILHFLVFFTWGITVVLVWLGTLGVVAYLPLWLLTRSLDSGSIWPAIMDVPFWPELTNGPFL